MPQPTVPTTLFPVGERFVNIGREAVAPGTAAATTVTLPVTSFMPDDKPVWLMDEAWRVAMAAEYDMIQGPIWTETAFGGPVFGDTIGHLFYNILGDWVATGTTTGTTTTINHGGGYPAGTTGLIVVASGTAFSAGAPGFVQIDTLGNAETVAYSAAGATSITLSGTTRFAHATGVSVTQVTGPYTHGFALLNTLNGQGPSHTFIDRTQVPGSGNFLAVQYTYGCLSKLTLTGNAAGLLTYSATMLSWPHAYPTGTVTSSTSTVRATPNWRSLVGLGGPASGGTLTSNIAEWVIEIGRVIEPIPTADGVQNPYVMARGKLNATATLKIMPSIDETALTYMLNNTQPQLQILYSNGLSGVNNITYTIDAQLTAFDTAKINESSTLFGYDVTSKLIANTTNVSGANISNSGGYSPLHIQLQNNVAAY